MPCQLLAPGYRPKVSVIGLRSLKHMFERAAPAEVTDEGGRYCYFILYFEAQMARSRFAKKIVG